MLTTNQVPFVITHFLVIPQIYFFSSKKSKKNIFELKTKKIQKIITVRRGCQSAQKIARNWLRRLKNSKIKI
jgi:hypothetical protein